MSDFIEKSHEDLQSLEADRVEKFRTIIEELFANDQTGLHTFFQRNENNQDFISKLIHLDNQLDAQRIFDGARDEDGFVNGEKVIDMLLGVFRTTGDYVLRKETNIVFEDAHISKEEFMSQLQRAFVAVSKMFEDSDFQAEEYFLGKVSLDHIVSASPNPKTKTLPPDSLLDIQPKSSTKRPEVPPSSAGAPRGKLVTIDFEKEAMIRELINKAGAQFTLETFPEDKDVENFFISEICRVAEVELRKTSKALIRRIPNQKLDNVVSLVHSKINDRLQDLAMRHPERLISQLLVYFFSPGKERLRARLEKRIYKEVDDHFKRVHASPASILAPPRTETKKPSYRLHRPATPIAIDVTKTGSNIKTMQPPNFVPSGEGDDSGDEPSAGIPDIVDDVRISLVSPSVPMLAAVTIEDDTGNGDDEITKVTTDSHVETMRFPEPMRSAPTLPSIPTDSLLQEASGSSPEIFGADDTAPHPAVQFPMEDSGTETEMAARLRTPHQLPDLFSDGGDENEKTHPVTADPTAAELIQAGSAQQAAAANAESEELVPKSRVPMPSWTVRLMDKKEPDIYGDNPVKIQQKPLAKTEAAPGSVEVPEAPQPARVQPLVQKTDEPKPVSKFATAPTQVIEISKQVQKPAAPPAVAVPKKAGFFSKAKKWIGGAVLATAAALGIYSMAQTKSTVDETAPTVSATASNNTAPKPSEQIASSASAVASTEEAPIPRVSPQVASVAPQVSSQPDVQQKAPEVAAILASYSYALGSSAGAAAPFTGTASLVEGGVDATPFDSSLKSSAWYQGQQKSAELLLKIYDSNSARLEKNTAAFVKDHEKMLRDLASQTNFNPLTFHAHFENSYGKSDLFGATGVYNELLGVQRVLNLYGGDSEKLLKDAAIVKLTIGNKIQAPAQRFANAVQFKASSVSAPAQQNNGNISPQPKDLPQQNQPDGGKSGFNRYQINPDNTHIGFVPTNILQAQQGSTYAFAVPQIQPQENVRAPQKVYPGSSKNVRTKFLDDWKAREAKKIEDAKAMASINSLKEKIEASYELDQIDVGWDTIDEMHAVNKTGAQKESPQIEVKYSDVHPAEIVEYDRSTALLERGEVVVPEDGGVLSALENGFMQHCSTTEQQDRLHQRIGKIRMSSFEQYEVLTDGKIYAKIALRDLEELQNIVA